MNKRTRRAFTLIELLIVVAIIAILASIAVPNFAEAQVRSKVSRAKADIRSIATAVESYHIDWSEYPVPSDIDGMPNLPPFPDHPNQVMIPTSITTPIAYIAARPLDPFTPEDPGLFHFMTREYELLHHGDYHGFDDKVEDILGSGVGVVQYFLSSKGPDKVQNLGGHHSNINVYYDPTNGTVSRGDIVYWGPGTGFSR